MNIYEESYNEFLYRLGLLYDFVILGNGCDTLIIEEFSEYISQHKILYRGIVLDDYVLESMASKETIDLGRSYSTNVNTAIMFSKKTFGNKKEVIITNHNSFGIYIPDLIDLLEEEFSDLYSLRNEEIRESLSYVNREIKELRDMAEDESEVIIVDKEVRIDSIIFDGKRWDIETSTIADEKVLINA